MGKQHDSQKTDANSIKKVAIEKEKDFIDGLANALSNDENGFSNKEGFNKDGEHKNLADNPEKKS